MKTKLIIPFFVLMVASTMSLMAQDTIDTTYYRYNFHRPPRYYEPESDFTLPEMPPVLYDTLTGQYVTDPETGEYIPVCPNGLGFTSFGQISGTHPWYYDHYDLGYKICKMNQPTTTVYGIAVSFGNITNFTAGDYVEIILAERHGANSHIIPFDTIQLKGGEIGISRHMEIPLMPQQAVRGSVPEEVFLNYCSTVHDNCIEQIIYAPIKEFYFDTPHQLVGDTMWICFRTYHDGGSDFHISVIENKYTSYNYATVVYEEDGEYVEDIWFPYNHYNIKTMTIPIIEPLPDWEVVLLDTLIPMPTKPENPDPDPNDPNNPDNPGDPNDPDNPEDPNDPDNPEDPDDPTDPEAIDGVYGNLPISIYPNPTSGVTTITSPEAIKELTVTDLAGRVMLHQSSLGASTTLDTAPLEPGLYLLKVTTASGTATTKLAVR